MHTENRLRILCSCFLLPLLLLTACSSRSLSSADAVVKPLPDPSMPADNLFHPDTDCQTSWIVPINQKYFAQADEGIYFAGGQRLYCIGEDAMVPSPVCSDPDCSHAWNAPGCTAVLPDNVSSLQYIYGHLYYYTAPAGRGDAAGGTIRCLDVLDTAPAGGTRRTVLQDGVRLQSTSGIVVHRGSLYIYCIEEDTAAGEAWERVYQYPLSGSGQLRKIWEKSCDPNSVNSVFTSNLAARGNYLFILNTLTGTDSHDLIGINLLTGQTRICPDWNGSGSKRFAFSGDRIYVLFQNDSSVKVMSFALDFSDPVSYPLMEMEYPEGSRSWDVFLAADEQYLYCWQYQAEFLDIFDPAGNPVDAVDMTQYFRPGGLTLYVSPLEHGTVFLTWPGSSSYFQYFKKDEIGTGQIQLKRLPQVSGENFYSEPDAEWSGFY